MSRSQSTRMTWLGMSARDGEGRVADEARLAAGADRLARLPMLRLALDDEGLQAAQRIGAALGGDRLLHELAPATAPDAGWTTAAASSNAAANVTNFLMDFLPLLDGLCRPGRCESGRPSLREAYHRRKRPRTGHLAT